MRIPPLEIKIPLECLKQRAADGEALKGAPVKGVWQICDKDACTPSAASELRTHNNNITQHNLILYYIICLHIIVC